MYVDISRIILISIGLLGERISCCYLGKFRETDGSLEEGLNLSQIVFRGYMSLPYDANSVPNNTEVKHVTFDVLDLYKSEDGTQFRKLNVTFEESNKFTFDGCAGSDGVITQDYIVFCKMKRTVLWGFSLIKWSKKDDEFIWNALGWSNWSDWSSCTVSCATGTQKRTRICTKNHCFGPGIEERPCNLFECKDVVNPLEIGKSKFFHPSKDSWQHYSDRPTAWKFKLDSYMWIPSPDMFPLIDGRWLPRHFVLFVTLRTDRGDELQDNFGTVLSLRSKRRQDTYFSLEVAGPDIKIVLASANGTEVVRIPMTLSDGLWHQVAIGFRNDGVLDVYVDCEWASTIVFGKKSINIPGDSDLIIGYLFTGDIEQVSIASDAKLVSLQCTKVKTPVPDNKRFVVDERVSTKTTLDVDSNTTSLNDTKF